MGRNYTKGAPFTITNDLPIVTIAADQTHFPRGRHQAEAVGYNQSNLPPIPEWQRWNDYGIGLLLEGNTGARRAN